MSRDQSLEEIDLVKLLVYILIFVLICLMMVLFFIVPNVKEYRKIQHEMHLQNSHAVALSKEQESKTKTITAFKNREKALIRAFEIPFSKDRFTAFASKYFSDVKLSQLPPKDSDEPFFRYELNVTSSVQTPVKFYDFIDALQRYDNVIRVDFPIHMQGSGEHIRTTFNIKVYGVK